MATTPLYSDDCLGIAKTLVNADSTNWVDLFDNSAGTNSARVEALNLCSTDTSTVNIQLGLYNGSATILVGTSRAVTLAGTDGAVLRVNMLATCGNVCPDGIVTIEVPGGWKLQAKSLVAVTADKTVSITGHARTYA